MTMETEPKNSENTNSIDITTEKDGGVLKEVCFIQIIFLTYFLLLARPIFRFPGSDPREPAPL